MLQSFSKPRGFKVPFADKSALKCNFGSKLVKVRRGTPALYRPQVFPSYNLPIPWQVLTFGEFAMQTNEMFTLVNIEHKLVETIRVAIFFTG